MTMTWTPARSTEPLAPVRRLAYASVGRRAAATVVDMLVLVAFAGVIAVVAGANDGPSFVLEGPPALVLLVGFWIHQVLMEAQYGGTFGKLALGVRVVHEDGTAVRMPAAIVRNALRLVDGFAFYLVGAVLAWRSPRCQRLGDRMAGTMVVVREAEAWRTGPHAVVPGAPRRSGAVENRRRRRAAWSVAACTVVVVTAAVAGARFSVSFGPDRLSGGRVERALVDGYAALGVPVAAPSCPSVKEEEGATVDCSATVAGADVDFRGVVAAGEGDLRFRPMQSILRTENVVAAAATRLTETAGRAASVDCGPDDFIVRAPGATFTCVVAFADSGTQVMVATVTDAEGNFTFDVR